MSSRPFCVAGSTFGNPAGDGTATLLRVPGSGGYPTGAPGTLKYAMKPDSFMQRYVSPATQTGLLAHPDSFAFSATVAAPATSGHAMAHAIAARANPRTARRRPIHPGGVVMPRVY